jgi:rhodanese-related sulfurtransferase
MSSATRSGRSIAQARQTTLGLYVTAKEAYHMWQADPEGVKILDVRTPEEWVFVGHTPMAVNVPVEFMAYVWDEEARIPVAAEPRLRRTRAGAVRTRRHDSRLLPLRRPIGDRDQHARRRRLTQRLQHPRRDGGQ